MKAYEVHFFDMSGQCVEVQGFLAVNKIDLNRQCQDFVRQSPLAIVSSNSFLIADESDILCR